MPAATDLRLSLGSFDSLAGKTARSNTNFLPGLSNGCENSLNSAIGLGLSHCRDLGTLEQACILKDTPSVLVGNCVYLLPNCDRG